MHPLPDIFETVAHARGASMARESLMKRQPQRSGSESESESQSASGFFELRFRIPIPMDAGLGYFKNSQGLPQNQQYLIITDMNEAAICT
jgi:hypothetical protein